MKDVIKDSNVTTAAKPRKKRTISIQSKINSIDKKIEKTQKALDALSVEKEKLLEEQKKEEAAKKKDAVKKIIKELKDSGITAEELAELLK